MSRSRKKTPVCKDKTCGMKAAANRKVRRRTHAISNGNAYRRIFPSYDISDFSIRTTKAEAKAFLTEGIKEKMNGCNGFPMWLRRDIDLEQMDLDTLTYEEVDTLLDEKNWRRTYYSK